MDDLVTQRIASLEALSNAGIDPYPPRANRTHTAAEAIALVASLPEGAGEDDAPRATVAGRVMARRGMGKATFIDLQDSTGRIQALVRRNAVGDGAYGLLEHLDLGDFIEVEGGAMRTRTGEPTIGATGWTMLAKALRPPPEKYHGLADVELRHRHRYLDLMANETTRHVFQTRSRVVSAIRRFLDGRGFLEVETPVLQVEAGGAAARPFETYFNALDEPRHLRISLELYLKRLLVGGLDKVYEIGRIFRNEGLSPKHNPEFTMMETYEAYADYRDVARMVEEMISSVAQEVLGTQTVTYRDTEINLAPPWTRITMHEALQQYAGLDLDAFGDEASLRAELERRGLDIHPAAGFGKLVDEAVSHYVEPKLIQPTFLLDYPVELSPLAKRKPENPRLVERFEPFIGGFEIGNAYTELNDPLDQRRRFEEQRRLQAAGDEEAEMLDEEFLFALEHAFPPTGGLGIGIDRLVMILTGQPNIREVILFPQMRTLKPQGEAADDGE